MPVILKDLLLAILFVCLTMVFTRYVQAAGVFSASAQGACDIHPNTKYLQQRCSQP
jgi:tetrahydromethanopterin S-methyltransferase subunit D